LALLYSSISSGSIILAEKKANDNPDKQTTFHRSDSEAHLVTNLKLHFT
jgi:hypothetical protein